MMKRQAKLNSTGQFATPGKRKLQGAVASANEKEASKRYRSLQNILRGKRQEIMKEIQENVDQSLAEEQQRRAESFGNAGEGQAVMVHECEGDIFLMEMRNRRRQSLDEALVRLHKGAYGICAECGIDINLRRLQVVPFAKLCAECLSRAEQLETSELVLDRIGLGFTAVAIRTSRGLKKSRVQRYQSG